MPTTEIFEIIPWFLAVGAIVVAYFEHKEKIKIETKPNLDIYTTLGQLEIEKIELKIKNYGPGIARNIQFQFLEGGDFLTPSGEKIKDLDLLQKGIDSLGPNMEKFFILTNLKQEYVEQKMNANFSISISYYDENGVKYDPNPFNIRLREYHGLKYPNRIISASKISMSAATSSTDFTSEYSDPSGNLPP